MDMEAIEYTNQEICLEHVRKPRPEVKDPKDVLVMIFFSGISMLDLYIVDDVLPYSPEGPVCLGREFCGMVIEIGDEVTTVRKGDKVVIDPNRSCGLCSHCREGRSHFCKISSYGIGGWAEFALVPEIQVYKLLDTIPMERGLLVYPMAMVCQCLTEIAPIKSIHNVLVLGAGLSGHLCTALLHFYGHRKITVCDSSLYRLEYGKKIEEGVECITPQLLKERKTQDPEYAFQFIIDFTDEDDFVDLAFSILDKGGVFVVSILKHPGARMRISPFELYCKAARIVAIDYNRYSFAEAMNIIEHLGDKQVSNLYRYLDFEFLGIKEYTLTEYMLALRHTRKKSVVKAMFGMTIRCTCPKHKRPRSP